MRALIVEQHYAGGHYLFYVSAVVRALDGVASEILVALPPGARDAPQYKLHLAPLEGKFKLVEMSADRPGNPAKMIWALSGMLRDLIRTHRPDALYLPTGDGFVDAVNLARLLGRSVVGSLAHSEVLLMRRPAAYGVPDPRLPALLSRLSIRIGGWSRVLTICPFTARWLQTCCGRGVAAAAVHAPDPIESPPPIDRRAARRAAGLPEDGRIVAALGMNDMRKGVDLLLRAFQKDRGLQPNDRLLIAGPMPPDVRAVYDEVIASSNSLAERITVVDRYISHDQLHLYASASDLVAACYRSVTQPSGIAIRALAAHRPVIANNRGWFGYMVPKFQMGAVCDVENIDTFAEALAPALDNAHIFTPSAAALRLLEYQKPENFILTWREGLARKMGAPMPAEPLRWEWVTAALERG
jgi:glycosyltransferase involved in cell wall biosynthesis